MYFCGPTVYQRIHIGNARPFVISMWLRRWLKLSGYEVTLAENITDINDKIYAAAPGDSARRPAEAADWYREDTSALGLDRPDVEPQATESVPAIVAMIGQLVSSGHAYHADGDVYFRVASFPDYGKLSGRHGDEEATRNPSEEDEEAARKQDPLDFALWKARKEGEDTSWESPWGPGRPGWHIECSAMAEALLGVDFDIHGGGIDLAFPHHENEAAQTFAARGAPLARIWMHNGMLELGKEKMAKSVGNIRGLREVLDAVGPEVLLLFMSTGHYRQPLTFSDEALESAKASVARIREAGRRLLPGPSPASLEPHRDAFFAALRNDFNTAEALASLYGWIREANRSDEPVGSAHLLEMLDVLVLETLLAAEEGPPPEAVELAEARDGARARKDWGEADRLRDDLRARGWEVRDGPDGPELVRSS